MRARLLALALALAACGNTAAPQPAPPAAAPAPPLAPAAKGRVVRTRFASAALGVTKHVVVYLPASYDTAPARRYPVFYYLHGLGGDETNWIDGGKLDEAADALGLEAIVVMPDGDDSFYANALTKADYDACKRDGTGLLVPSQSKSRTCVRRRDYETYIVEDLVRWAETTYRALGTREGRAIAGLSMGGFGAWMLALRHPDRFAAAASHSGVIALLYEGPVPYERGQVTMIRDAKQWGGALPFGAWVRSIFGVDLAHWRAHDPAHLVTQLPPSETFAAPRPDGLGAIRSTAPRLYLDCGTADEFLLHNAAAYVHDLLVDRNVAHEYYVGPGRHDFGFWRARLPKSLQFLRDSTSRAQ